jgi:molybdenum cofactor synthesis domain-containing protein
MRPIKRLIQLDEALKIALGVAEPVKRTERTPILETSGRIAAENVVSRVSVPPFARSAMDGYAVRARDTFGASKLKPVRLKKRQVIYAGSVPERSVGKGECAEIATGAMLPKGADATVMVEDTELDEGHVLISESVHPGQNISKMGEDISPGDRIIKKGELLNPSKIGALAAIGEQRLNVYAKPIVAVVPSGDEISSLGKKLRPGQVYDINTYTLSSVVNSNGAEARNLGIVNDSVDDIVRLLESNSDCDMIVFSGGSSVGERDVMLDVLEKKGRVLFHGVAIKPGKPTLFGTVGRQLVFGMPGYPTACLSNAYILLAPVLRRMARLPEKHPASVVARMSKRVVSTTGRTQFLTVRLEGDVAHPAFKESGAITSMAYADGYIVIPADVDLVERDEKVCVYLL